MNTERIRRFVSELEKALANNTFVKLNISSRRVLKDDLKSVSAKVVQTKKGTFLSLVYRNETNDVTKNHAFDSVCDTVVDLLTQRFFQAELSTTEANWHLILNAGVNGKLKRKDSLVTEAPAQGHDRTKKRWVSVDNNIYLRELGVLDSKQRVRPSKQDKFRQINKYVEEMDRVIRNAELPKRYTVADMGSGSGYLTFALYDHLVHGLKHDVEMTGVEIRENLINKCNAISDKCGFDGLRFELGHIQESEQRKIDVLIALHACDTATDDAIFRGIGSESKVIVVAPCCQKQVRRNLNPKNELADIAQFGILKERQAELLTDGLRAMIMEAHGYRTKVFEFISTEHTPKNILIVGIKSDKSARSRTEILKRIESIKQIHGLEEHYLETLLK